jgi:chromosome segregation ATPase
MVEAKVTLADQIAESAKQFDRECCESQLCLLKSDTLAATAQRDQLDCELGSLSESLEGLKSRLDGLNAESSKLATGDPPESEDSTKFFTYLNALETREVENRARLEGHRQLQGNLRHQITLLGQQNAKLSSEFARLSAKADADEDAVKKLQDEMADLQTQIDRESGEGEFLASKSDDLKSELFQRSEDLKRSGDDHGIREELRKREEELRQLRAKTAQLRAKQRAGERAGAARLSAKAQEREKAGGLSAWWATRSALMDKLRRLRTELASETRAAALAEKRDHDLGEKLRTLTGEADGDSARARRVLMAEIAGEREAKRQAVVESDIQCEEEYTREIAQQLRIADASMKEFEAHREEAVGALQQELMQCEKTGYIAMLREELAALQADAAKL